MLHLGLHTFLLPVPIKHLIILPNEPYENKMILFVSYTYHQPLSNFTIRLLRCIISSLFVLWCLPIFSDPDT